MEFTAPKTLHAATKGITGKLNYVLDHNAFNVGELELHDDHVLVTHQGNVNFSTFEKLTDPVGTQLRKEMTKAYTYLGDARRKKDTHRQAELTRIINELVELHFKQSVKTFNSTPSELIKRNRKLDADVEVDEKNGRYTIRVVQKIKHEDLPAGEVKTLTALRESIKRGEASRKLTKLVERSWLKLKI